MAYQSRQIIQSTICSERERIANPKRNCEKYLSHQITANNLLPVLPQSGSLHEREKKKERQRNQLGKIQLKQFPSTVLSHGVGILHPTKNWHIYGPNMKHNVLKNCPNKNFFKEVLRSTHWRNGVEIFKFGME
ncbi:unnamed protein product [Dovyalis caffra]|uniref:Uncharacterized protein n=1 Tax=Dovyalis caffra TaxID=77055 RepID=A0AAV1S2H1_9ROSI|nr:unnamed protein product [Dovyalis caffra]